MSEGKHSPSLLSLLVVLLHSFLYLNYSALFTVEQCVKPLKPHLYPFVYLFAFS